MQAMILAAGFGTRLRPYTEQRPKPLFPILNQPLLLLTIARLKNAGFHRIVVNCHHLGEQIAAAVDGLEGVILQPEEELLGTGGGLRQALDHLGDEPLLVTTGDIYHSIDLAALYRFHLSHSSRLTMAIHDYPQFNKVAVAGGRIRGFAARTGGQAFTGIQIVDPGLLEPIKRGVFSSIIDHYEALLAKDEMLQAYGCTNHFWTDMGTVEAYLALHRALLLGEAPLWSEIGEVTRPFCLAKEAKLAPDLDLKRWAAIGAAEIGAGVQLSECVVWDGAKIAAGEKHKNTILGAG